ncbi:MAG: hypothetical protein RLZZ400_611 [Actinomycetota bacterium]|jgi:signal peptidase I
MSRVSRKQIAIYALSALVLICALLNVFGVISLRLVATSSMQGTIDQGSLVVSANWLKPAVGDIAIYRESDPSGQVEQFVVHRVIAGDAINGYTFQGDNNQSADPNTVEGDRVVGVVQFWIPAVATLVSWPMLLLYASISVFVIVLRKNSDRRFMLFAKLNKLTGWKRRTWLSGIVALGVVLIFSGLSLTGLFRLVHPQVGPSLPVGTSTNSIVAISPNSTFGPGDLAIATINTKSALVRIESVKGSSATVTSTFGRLSVKNSDVQGRIVFFIPFIGVIFEPFDK